MVSRQSTEMKGLQGVYLQKITRVAGKAAAGLQSSRTDIASMATVASHRARYRLSC
jgi:hypothetical protein